MPLAQFPNATRDSPLPPPPFYPKGSPSCPPPIIDQPAASSTTMVTLRSQRDTGKSVPPERPDLAGLEFCKFMSYGLSWEKMVLPDKFGSALMGRGLREVKLRVAGGGERRVRDVKVVPDEYGDVYLAGGWRAFARANGLDLGQLLVFRYDGVALITVTILEGRGRPYQHEEQEQEEDAAGTSSPPAPAPAPTDSGSSSGGTAEAGADDPAPVSQFSVMLRQCHFGKKQGQYLQVPMWFLNAQGYTKRSKAVELRMQGKSWTVNLKQWGLSTGKLRIGFRYGWHQFLVDNGLSLGDTCIFHAVQGEGHVLRVVVHKHDGTIVQ